MSAGLSGFYCVQQGKYWCLPNSWSDWARIRWFTSSCADHPVSVYLCTVASKGCDTRSPEDHECEAEACTGTVRKQAAAKQPEWLSRQCVSSNAVILIQYLCSSYA